MKPWPYNNNRNQKKKKVHYKATFHIDGAWDVDYRLDVEAENQTEAIKLVGKLAPGAFNIELQEQS